MTNKVLIVRVSSLERIDYISMRDDILESVRLGVLILGQDDTLEVMELPPLGQVEVLPAEDPADLEPEISSEPSTVAEEKRAILQRLKEYRTANGLGTLEAIAAKTAHNKSQRMSADALQSILTGVSPPVPIEEWRKISRALDKLEQEAVADG